MTLVTPAPHPPMSGLTHMLLSFMSNGKPPHVAGPGLIEIGHFNAEQEWTVGPWYRIEERDEVMAGDGPFGFKAGEDRIHVSCVADSIDQWKGRYAEKVEALDQSVCAFFTHVAKEPENRGRGGGWRWHKWGEYVGEGDPRREYLDDEEGFENGVYVVRLHPVLVPAERS